MLPPTIRTASLLLVARGPLVVCIRSHCSDVQAKMSAPFITSLFACPELPPPSTNVSSSGQPVPSPKLAQFVTYVLHRTRFAPCVTFAALYLQRLKNCFPAARGSSGHLPCMRVHPTCQLSTAPSSSPVHHHHHHHPDIDGRDKASIVVPQVGGIPSAISAAFASSKVSMQQTGNMSSSEALKIKALLARDRSAFASAARWW